MAAQRRLLVSAALCAAARASFMRIGSTLIFTMVVAGEDASAMGMNSRLRAQAGGRFSARMVNSCGAGFFGHALQVFCERSSTCSFPA